VAYAPSATGVRETHDCTHTIAIMPCLFPLQGTFLANQLGCSLDYVMRILSVRLGNLDLTQDAAIFAAIAGFLGSLSTVSTWAVEVGRCVLHLFTAGRLLRCRHASTQSVAGMESCPWLAQGG